MTGLPLNTEKLLDKIEETDPKILSRSYIYLGPIIINGLKESIPQSHIEEIVRRLKPEARFYKEVQGKPVAYDEITKKVIEVKHPYFCIETYRHRWLC